MAAAHGDMRDRIQQARAGCLRLVTRLNEHTRAWLRHATGEDSADPGTYDLLLEARGTQRPLRGGARRARPVRRVAMLAYRLLDARGERPCYGGGERVCYTLASLLREQGCEVTLYQTAERPFVGDYHGFPVIGLAVKGGQYSEFQHGVSEAFYQRSLAYDGVIYNQPELASGLYVRPDALLICHGVWFDHRNYPEHRLRSREWFRHLHQAFAQPGIVVSVDTNSINVIRALWPELASRMHYIPNFADTTLFYPPVKREPGELTVLIPRRGHVNRGTQILGEMLRQIPHPCRVRWIGDGPAADTELILQLAERDRRLSYGTATFAEMPAHYRAADICVIPTVACEGTSLSCIESLASGCATVATHVGGLPDIIQPGVNGLLVDPTPAALGGAISYLLTEAGERERLQAAGRASAQHFDRVHWRQRWLRLLAREGWLAPEAADRAGAPTWI